MTTLSGLKNIDVAAAVTAMREMYGVNVILSIRPAPVANSISFLRVEWSPVQIWRSEWVAAAEMAAPSYQDFPLAPYEAISPAILFRALMVSETTIERYYVAAAAAGMPPVGC